MLVLENIHETKLQKISDNLKPVSFDENSYIIREGEPIDTAYFIMRGVAIEWSFKARVNGEATTSSSQYPNWLEKGAFFGQELLHEWTSGQQASSSSNIFNLPLSSKIVKSHTKVEAFALKAND